MRDSILCFLISAKNLYWYNNFDIFSEYPGLWGYVQANCSPDSILYKDCYSSEVLTQLVIKCTLEDILRIMEITNHRVLIQRDFRDSSHLIFDYDDSIIDVTNREKLEKYLEITNYILMIKDYYIE